MFQNFYLVTNHKISNISTTTKTREKIRTDFESLEFEKNMHVWLDFKTIKFYWKTLATDFLQQPSYIMGDWYIALGIRLQSLTP
jgi:hypothetical protein